MTAVAPFYSGDASVLAQALVAHVAREIGVRTLAIKGVTAAHHGVRAPKVSSDADVLVEPSGIDDLVDALGRRGWYPRLVPLEPHVISPHSITLICDEWPCDIDVHRHYPGLLADSALIFDELWRRREVIEIAHADVESVDKVGTTAILALHELRAPYFPVAQRRLDDLASRVKETFTPENLDDLLRFATVAVAIEPLRPFLQRLGVVPPRQNPPREAIGEWNALAHSPNRTILWVLELSRAPLREKPRVLWHAVFSSSAELRAQHPETPPGGRAIAALRLRRLKGGLRALPDALRALASFDQR